MQAVRQVDALMAADAGFAATVHGLRGDVVHEQQRHGCRCTWLTTWATPCT